jgi:inosine-uridine nucleoside N-ribohydrolase
LSHGQLLDRDHRHSVRAVKDVNKSKFYFLNAEPSRRSSSATFSGTPFGTADMPLNDPPALLVVGEPNLASTIPARVEVELAGRFTYGRAAMDFAGKSGRPPNRDVAAEIHVSATRSAFVRTLSRQSEKFSPDSS